MPAESCEQSKQLIRLQDLHSALSINSPGVNACFDEGSHSHRTIKPNTALGEFNDCSSTRGSHDLHKQDVKRSVDATLTSSGNTVEQRTHDRLKLMNSLS